MHHAHENLAGFLNHLQWSTVFFFSTFSLLPAFSITSKCNNHFCILTGLKTLIALREE